MVGLKREKKKKVTMKVKIGLGRTMVGLKRLSVWEISTAQDMFRSDYGRIKTP